MCLIKVVWLTGKWLLRRYLCHEQTWKNYIHFKHILVSTGIHQTFVKYGFMTACHLHIFIYLAKLKNLFNHVTENAEIVPFVTSLPCNLLDHTRGLTTFTFNLVLSTHWGLFSMHFIEYKLLYFNQNIAVKLVPKRISWQMIIIGIHSGLALSRSQTISLADDDHDHLHHTALISYGKLYWITMLLRSLANWSLYVGSCSMVQSSHNQ